MSIVTDPRAASAVSTLPAVAAAPKEDASERFLKLLVTQMKNQDPLNPMDNAQVTSQMAQINTVAGIDKLNETVKSLSSQMLSTQMLQGAGLVGRSVLLEGSQLRFSDSGLATGGFDLARAADSVKVEVLSPSGRVLDTIDMGAASSGRSGFEWQAPAGVATDGISFRVTAKSGSAAVSATPLSADLVRAVSTSGDSLQLELASGASVPYAKVKAIS